MKIGELLLLQEKIDPWVLSHTLKEQAHTRQRLVSMLINRALLDPDDGALVLSEQLGYPAALQRHLERRDGAVLAMLPPQLGSRWVVLPLVRAHTGQIVVVARDPTPILGAALEHAMRADVVLAVTPSVQLDRLVRAAYGATSDPDQELPAAPPTLSEIGEVALDEDTPLPFRRARTVSYMFQGLPELPVRTRPQASPIDVTLAEVDRAHTAGAVERLVMAYATKRWRSALLVRLEGNRAHGVRGHGPQLDHVEELVLKLQFPSMVTIARDTRHPTTHAPSSATQDKLHEVLGLPRTLAAAPILVGNDVVSVLVVGDIIDGAPSESLAEVDRLADALGAAYVRFARTS